VFLVGCGRSGTTVLYNTFAAHQATAWFSRWTDATRRPELALGAELYRRWFTRADRRTRRFLPYPSEGYRLWDQAVNLDPADTLRPLDNTDVTVGRARSIDDLVEAHLRYGHGRCFINKNTRNSRRVRFLASVYPDAAFIHVVRHPLDVVASLTEVAWWPDLALWTRQGASPRSLRAEGAEAAVLAAELWAAETSMVRRDLERLRDSERASEIHYEDFVRSPEQELGALLTRLGLDLDADTARFCTLVSAASVGTWDRRLSGDQRKAATAIVADLAGQFGYDT
jgi:hypothetical protein